VEKLSYLLNKLFEELAIMLLKELEYFIIMNNRVYSLSLIELSLNFIKLFAKWLSAELKR
jgi:hypothetical protein